MRNCLRAEPACPALGGPAGPRPPPGVKGAVGGEASLDTRRAAAVVASPHRGVVRPPLCGGPLSPAPAVPLATRRSSTTHTPSGCEGYVVQTASSHRRPPSTTWSGG